jgi:hypothetical protein
MNWNEAKQMFEAKLNQIGQLMVTLTTIQTWVVLMAADIVLVIVDVFADIFYIRSTINITFIPFITKWKSAVHWYLDTHKTYVKFAALYINTLYSGMHGIMIMV